MEAFEFEGVSGVMRSSHPLDEIGDITKPGRSALDPILAALKHANTKENTMDINQLLERIALAFEEQNRINQHWTKINSKWHEENSANTERIIAIHKANAKRDELWRKAQEAMLEEQIRKQDALTQSAHDAYLEHLKEQAKP